MSIPVQTAETAEPATPGPRPDAIFLMGPTASGKTVLALDWAERHGFALVSVDSANVYRGMDVGTAKPDRATLARWPHALVDIREPEEAYSAAEFAADARRALDEAAAQGRVPLLVGGTGLYFRALERGLSALPDADATVRDALAAEARDVGWPALHARLERVDPIAAARIHPNDPQRISRALEVIALTGRPLSEQQKGGVRRLPYRILKLALLPDDRSMLHARIEARWRTMVDAGLVDEVERLRARGTLTLDHPSMRAVGYRQTWDFLDGRVSREEWVERGVYATRQLAKRQITWIRSEHDAIPIPIGDAGLSRARELVARFLGR